MPENIYTFTNDKVVEWRKQCSICYQMDLVHVEICDLHFFGMHVRIGACRTCANKIYAHLQAEKEKDNI